MDDIVTRLREHLIRRDTRPSTHWDGCIMAHPICALAWALDEIEQLDIALHLAAGLLSALEPYQHMHPQQVLKFLLKEEVSHG